MDIRTAALISSASVLWRDFPKVFLNQFTTNTHKLALSHLATAMIFKANHKNDVEFKTRAILHMAKNTDDLPIVQDVLLMEILKTCSKFSLKRCTVTGSEMISKKLETILKD